MVLAIAMELFHLMSPWPSLVLSLDYLALPDSHFHQLAAACPARLLRLMLLGAAEQRTEAAFSGKASTLATENSFQHQTLNHLRLPMLLPEHDLQEHQQLGILESVPVDLQFDSHLQERPGLQVPELVLVGLVLKAALQVHQQVPILPKVQEPLHRGLRVPQEGQVPESVQVALQFDLHFQARRAEALSPIAAMKSAKPPQRDDALLEVHRALPAS